MKTEENLQICEIHYNNDKLGTKYMDCLENELRIHGLFSIL